MSYYVDSISAAAQKKKEENSIASDLPLWWACLGPLRIDDWVKRCRGDFCGGEVLVRRVGFSDESGAICQVEDPGASFCCSSYLHRIYFS
ncbi:hypothetical protein IGI04_016225, partial [Brassica rapa subsp. trilocularis]